MFIDDKLPTVDGKYIYAHCEDPREFWVALIEKAFAKLYGSYAAIEGGMPIGNVKLLSISFSFCTLGGAPNYLFPNKACFARYT